MKSVYNRLSELSSQKECNSCRICESNVGLVYLFEKERVIIEKIDRNIISRSINNVCFIKRKESGYCSCFDVKTGKCRIYINRPLCCRLYPIDFMKIDNQIWWVVHSECPIYIRYNENRDISILYALTISLEEEISRSEFIQWLEIDNVSVNIEAFSREQCSIVKLRKFKSERVFP